jgi:hypothetical protein
MKIEKEVLIKQHFWILLAVLVPLVLISLIVLWTAAASAVERAQKDFQSSEKGLQGINKPKNDKWLKDLQVRADEVTKQKNVIWSEAWQRQSDLLTWPDPNRMFEQVDPSDRQKFDNLAFGDAIPAKICEKYSNPNGPYREQLEPIIGIVNPVNDKGEGMVQFKGSWEAIIPPFDWNKKDIHRPVAFEELWILQEDLAVYRELLRIIRDVNELVATFHKVPGAPKPDKSKGEIDRQIFTNPTWKLDLTVAEEKNKKVFRCQMTNLSQRRQPLGIFFAVKIKGVDPQFIFADGEPLPPGGSFAVKDKDGNDQALQTVVPRLEGEVLEKVVQWFDWRTAPVKRIDQLAIGNNPGSHSDRTAWRGLKTLSKWEKPKEETTTSQEEGSSAPQGGMGGGGMMERMQQNMTMMKGLLGGGQGGAGGGGASAASGEKTKNGLPKNRYVDVSDQVRRMPIGIAVVIDQEFIPEFLTVVANSKLRIQTTQVYWQRFHEDIKPKITEEKPADGSTPKSKRVAATPRAGSGAMGPAGMGGFGGFDMSMMMNRMQGMRAQMMGGRPGAGGVRPAAAPTTSTTEVAEEDLDSNLVELAVHGIASLYEKFHEETVAAAANQ